MAQPALSLPSEVWTHVFGYLTAADKFSVRASCKYFKKLVDHASLWRDWCVVLDFRNGAYNNEFWALLRRRRVTGVVVRSRKAKDWKRLACSLPALSTVVMEQTPRESCQCLKDLPNLKRLSIRCNYVSLLLKPSTVINPHQLTHLSLCDVPVSISGKGSFTDAICQFVNLTSLVCHQVRDDGGTVFMIRSILTGLPKLTHLSLSAPCNLSSTCRCYPGPSGAAQGRAAAHSLSSLELIGCMEHALPEDAMRLMPGLKSLAVLYTRPHQEETEGWPLPECHLKTWLSDLPQLSTLVIVKGPPVQKYVTSIPATVTSLTLRIAGLSSDDLAGVAGQLPNLLHLHIDPWPSHLGAHTARIPQLFPKLRSLKLRHEHVPEKDFLHLRWLHVLERLEILDSRPLISVLIGKLRALTDYRLQVTTSPQQRDVFSCPCVCQVY